MKSCGDFSLTTFGILVITSAVFFQPTMGVLTYGVSENGAPQKAQHLYILLFYYTLWLFNIAMV